MQLGEINLATLGGGAAVEKFQEELQRVVANILDPNTNPKAKRKITLTVTIIPSHERGSGDVLIEAKSTLEPSMGYATRAYFGQQYGQPVAYEDNPQQVTIDQFIESTKQVAEIPRQKAQGE